jgi:hypothetical protein
VYRQFHQLVVQFWSIPVILRAPRTLGIAALEYAIRKVQGNCERLELNTIREIGSGASGYRLQVLALR